MVGADKGHSSHFKMVVWVGHHSKAVIITQVSLKNREDKGLMDEETTGNIVLSV